MNRIITLDLKTTEINLDYTDRVIEIACKEIITGIGITKHSFHQHINPEQSLDTAFRICDFTNEFLKDKPMFKDILDKLLKYLSNSMIVMHDARPKLNSLNSELKRLNYDWNFEEKFTIIDLHKIQKIRYPNRRYSIEGMCKYLDIDIWNTKTNPLNNAETLAEIYLTQRSKE